MTFLKIDIIYLNLKDIFLIYLSSGNFLGIHPIEETKAKPVKLIMVIHLKQTVNKAMTK